MVGVFARDLSDEISSFSVRAEDNVTDPNALRDRPKHAACESGGDPGLAGIPFDAFWDIFLIECPPVVRKAAGQILVDAEIGADKAALEGFVGVGAFSAQHDAVVVFHWGCSLARIREGKEIESSPVHDKKTKFSEWTP